MASLPAGSGGTKVTSNDVIQESAGPVYNGSLAAESQAEGGEFAEGKKQKVNELPKEFEEGERGDSGSKEMNRSSEGERGEDEQYRAGDTQYREGGTQYREGGTQHREGDTQAREEGSADQALKHESGDSTVKGGSKRENEDSTSKQEGEEGEDEQYREGDTQYREGDTQYRDGDTKHREGDTQAREDGSADQAPKHENVVSSAKDKSKHESEDSTPEKETKHADVQSLSHDHDDEPKQGKGIPEHLQHSDAGAPGPTGTAPLEALGDTSGESDATKYEKTKQDSGKRVEEKSSSSTTTAAGENSTSNSNENHESSASTSGKGVQDNADNSAAGAPGPTGTSPGEAIGSTPTEKHKKTDEEDESRGEQSSQSTSVTSTDEKSASTSSGNQGNSTSTSGKGVLEHAGDTAAGAPGPTGTSPGEAIGSTTGDSHEMDDTKEDANSNKTTSESSLPDRSSGKTAIQEEGTPTSGKGVLEHADDSAAGAPGPTGTSPGEAMGGTAGDSDVKSNENEDMTSDKTTSGSSLPDRSSEKTASQEEDTPTSGKGVLEHEDSPTAGAPGPTGTSPGEAIESSTQEPDLKKHGGTDAKDRPHHESTVDSSSSPAKSGEKSADHESQNQEASLTSEKHIAKHEAGKGTSKQKDDSSAAVGAPGTTGTAPGEALDAVQGNPEKQSHAESSDSQQGGDVSHSELAGHQEHNGRNETDDKNDARQTATDDAPDDKKHAPVTGKGVIEHNSHTTAGAPGPTGTALGEALGADEGDRNDNDQLRAEHSHSQQQGEASQEKHDNHQGSDEKEAGHQKLDAEHDDHQSHGRKHGSHQGRDDEKYDSRHNREEKHGSADKDQGNEGTPAAGKGVIEHSSHDMAAAPGPTGTAPGDAMG